MACWAASIAMAFLASALLLSSVPKVASTSSSPVPLIKDVCASAREEFGIDSKLCVETLESEPRVVAASDLVSISIALIEVGIAKATNTRSHVQKLLKQPGLKSDDRYVLQQCDSGYQHCLWSFGSALGEVKDKEYDTATYDIKIGYTDNIDECRNAMSSKKFKDDAISKVGEVLTLFGEVATNTLDRLPSEF